MKPKSCLFILVLMLALFVPNRNAQATAYTNDNWAALANTSGTNGAILAMAVDDANGLLYAGGDFTMINGVAANRVAVWDGATWSALGTGTSGEVRALQLNGSDLYVGGSFTTAGGVTTNGIAKWSTTGSTWSALGTGVSDTFDPFALYNPNVSALAIDGNDLYASGDFVMAGGVTVNGIAKWNGTAWSALGTGLAALDLGYPYIDISALAVVGSDIYVGGLFDDAGGSGARHLARWNGTAWSNLGGGLNAECSDLAVIGGVLYVAYPVYDAGPITGGDGVAKWNGSAWSPVGSIPHPDLFGPDKLAVAGGRLYAAVQGPESETLSEWNGTIWTLLGGANGTVHALIADEAGHLFLGGGLVENEAYGFTATGSLQIEYEDGVLALIQPMVSGTVQQLTLVPSVFVQQFYDPEYDMEPTIPQADGTGNLEFPPVVVASQGSSTVRFWINNTGHADLSLSEVTIDGANASDFSIVDARTPYSGVEGFPTSLVPGFFVDVGGNYPLPDYVDVLMEFTPSAVGARSAMLHIVSNVAGSESSYDIALTGAGIASEPYVKVGSSIASAITSVGATLNAGVWANGADTTVVFEYGTTTAYGMEALATPSPVTGTTLTAVSANITGLAPNTPYHFRAKATNSLGTTYGSDATFTTLGVPEIVVEQPVGVPLTDGVGYIPFKALAGGSSKTFTIRNVGTATLTGLGVSLTAPSPGWFSLGTLGTTELAPGASTTLIVTAHLQVYPPGFNTATLNIASNDADENPFDVLLTSSLLIRESWRVEHFGDMSSAGPGGDLLDPDKDGNPNVIEFATGLPPNASNPPPGQLVMNGNDLEFTYTRLKIAIGECTFTVEWKDDLASATWNTAGVVEVILSDDGVIETVRATVPMGTAGTRFVRLRVVAVNSGADEPPDEI